MGIKCKRIIGGKTYNTETATEIAGWDSYDGPYNYGRHLYQTRFGAFFSVHYRDGLFDDDEIELQPLAPDEARAWLEENAQTEPEIIERLFGEMPEAGSTEVKFTLRLPESLRNQLAERAEANKQSLNAWMVRCLERCARDVGEIQ